MYRRWIMTCNLLVWCFLFSDVVVLRSKFMYHSVESSWWERSMGRDRLRLGENASCIGQCTTTFYAKVEDGIYPAPVVQW
ncbi:hypothetical protein HOY82DRAFT_572839 [Tuber indicum]|nr:hypothetical protein HOY82DRAFT_572839 [Tuber indicum]